jgi:hypothetical protein
MPSREVARDMKVSCRRIEQIWKHFMDHGREPIIGEGIGRPRKPYDEKEASVVKEAHLRFKFGARMLEVLIRKLYKIKISHNRIHIICISCLRDCHLKIQINKSGASGSGMNENTVCPQDISIGMRMNELG